jgi:beta-lactamase class A
MRMSLIVEEVRLIKKEIKEVNKERNGMFRWKLLPPSSGFFFWKDNGNSKLIRVGGNSTILLQSAISQKILLFTAMKIPKMYI